MSEQNSSKDNITENDTQGADISFKKPGVNQEKTKKPDELKNASFSFDQKTLDDLDKLFAKDSAETAESSTKKESEDIPDMSFGSEKKRKRKKSESVKSGKQTSAQNVEKTEASVLPQKTVDEQDKKAGSDKENKSADVNKPKSDAEQNKKTEKAKEDTQSLAKELLDTVEKTAVIKRPVKSKKTQSEQGKKADDQKNEVQETIVVKRPETAEKASSKAYISDTKIPVKKKRKKKKSKSAFNNSIFGGLFLSFAIIAVALVLAIGGISLGREYLGIDKNQNDITFNIPKGSTSSDIADLLEENNIIEHKTFFELILKLKAPDTIYPGDITLQPSMGYTAIINKLSTMRESYETATISFPEGVTLLEAAQLLEKNGVCKADDFLFEFNKDQGFDFEKQVTGNDNAFYHMEGYFFPDTYDFYKNDKGYNITRTVREHFAQKLTDKMLEKMKQENLTLNQLMTLASMVQWESGSVEDMPKVASVFLNRLNDPDTFPSFQSDATEKYIVKVIKEKATTKAEQEHYSESYDTYHHKGLPAGPICNPGIEAINAVLNPEKTNYYYFCNNLETGESFFAETLEEHEVNLEKAGLK